MTKAKKLRAIEMVAMSIELDTHSFVCTALEDIGSEELRYDFVELFHPDWWSRESGGAWTFECLDAYGCHPSTHEEEVSVRLLALCLFYEMVRTDSV